MPIENRAGLAAEALAALDDEVARQAALADVIRWGLRQDPQLIVAEVVVQDEYTHDVLVPYRDGAWLAYDTT